MALPMTLIIISGEIDLSVAVDPRPVQRPARLPVGQALADAGHLPGRRAGAGSWPALINGLLVTRVGLPSLAVTIGTLALYRGVALILLGDRTRCPTSRSGTPASASTRCPAPRSRWNVAIFAVLAVIFGGRAALHRRSGGRSTRWAPAPEAATFAGIRVKRVKFLLFVVVRPGLPRWPACSGRSGSASARCRQRHSALELAVVAAVLLGGVSIFGGRGSLGGVVLAVVAFSASAATRCC